MADVRYTASFESAGAQRKVEEFDRSVRGLAPTTDKTRAAFGTLFKQLTAGFATVAIAHKGFSLLKTQLTESVEAAAEAELMEKRLSSALEITGRNIPTKHFIDYASSLQRATIYGDEEIKSVQALLIQMTHLNRDGLDAATRGTIGLASVMGTDLKSAANLVFKALEGNWGALSRYGVTVDETLSQEEKQAQMLEKLGALYKRAEADVDSITGRIKQLQNTWNDLQEVIGKAIVSSERLNQTLRLLKLAISEIQRAMEAGAGPTTIWGLAIEGAADFIQQHFGPALAYLALNAAKARAEMEKLPPRAMPERMKAASESIRMLGKFAADAGTEIKDLREEMEGLRAIDIWPPELFEMPDLDLAAMFPDLFPFQEEIQETVSVWDSAMLAMTAGIVSFGDASATVIGNIGAIFSNFIQSAISGIESLIIKQIWASRMTVKAKQGEATASHIANIFKSVPFPLDLILAAGAFAVVNALFAKIMKFEKGAQFQKPTYIHQAIIGEAGPEYLLPEKKLVQIVREAIVVKPTVSVAGAAMPGAGAGASVPPSNFVFSGDINIYAQTLTEDIIRRAGPIIFREFEHQARIRGGRLIHGGH